MPSFAAQRLNMVEAQIRINDVTDPRILAAMNAVAREKFVPRAAVALAYLSIGLPGGGAWVLFGTAMRKALSDPHRVRPFNLTMAALLVASIVPVLFE